MPASASGPESVKPWRIASRASCGASLKPWAREGVEQLAQARRAAPRAAPAELLLDGVRDAQVGGRRGPRTPSGRRRRSSAGANVSHTLASVSRWISDRTTVTAIDALIGRCSRAYATATGSGLASQPYSCARQGGSVHGEEQPRPVNGQVVAITGGARGIGKRHRAGTRPRGREGRDRRPRRRADRADRRGARRRHRRPPARRHRPRVVRGLPRRRRGASSGPIDVLINNAGIMPLGRFAEEDDATDDRASIDINVHGVLTGTKLAIRAACARGRGHIVNIASMAGKSSPPGGATYFGAKHAVVGFTEAVQMENTDYGIEVTIVMPVVVNTELGSGLKDTRGVKTAEPEDVGGADRGRDQGPQARRLRAARGRDHPQADVRPSAAGADGCGQVHEGRPHPARHRPRPARRPTRTAPPTASPGSSPRPPRRRRRSGGEPVEAAK